MAELLFLAHRIPYPPNRGDKMRSWHILKHLARFGRVHLGAFADDEADAAHLPALREALGESLGETYVEPRHRKLGWPVRALVRNEPASVARFSGSGMAAFTRRILARPEVRSIYAFSIQMAQFVPPAPGRPFVMDFVDLDSAKFAEYAGAGSALQRLIYRREAHRLLAFERETARRADASLFVSEAEAALFRARGGAEAAGARTLANGIDVAHYDPDAPFVPLDPPPAGPLIVFTGQMDYRPNVEAVGGFARDVLPRIRVTAPEARFAIVGRHPSPAVTALAHLPGVIVTGEVADVRPWLAAATAVVAPLGIARGVQNKVLEAMAMGRPVVASTAAFTGIDAMPGRDLVVADGADAQAFALLSLLADPGRAEAIGAAARARMVEGYAWEAQLAPLAGLLGLGERQAA
jgi:polysaccharide biosynthesis protein PslH